LVEVESIVVEALSNTNWDRTADPHVMSEEAAAAHSVDTLHSASTQIPEGDFAAVELA